MNRQERRFKSLCSYRICETSGKFSIHRPENMPAVYDKAYCADLVFMYTYGRVSGRLDNISYPYPEELFRSIQFTEEYKEWEALLPLI